MLQHEHRDGDVGLAREGGDAALGQGELDAQRRAEREDFVAEVRRFGSEGQALGGGGKGDDGDIADRVTGDDKGGQVGAVAVDQPDFFGLAHDMGVGHGHAAVGPDEGGTEEAVLGIGGADGEDLVHRGVKRRGAGRAEDGDQRQDQKRCQRLDKGQRSVPLWFGLHWGNPCSASVRNC